jgi:hypothetical protein
MRLRCLAGGALFTVWLLAIDSARGRDPGRGPPTDTGPPAGLADGRPESVSDPPLIKLTSAATPAPLSDPAELDLWHQNLIRERQVEVRLRIACRDIAAGRVIAGLTALQTIIERDEDTFLRFDTESIPCGAHTLALRIIESLPAAALETYESLCGSQARQELDAIATPDPERLGRIVRRFYHTAAGFDAGNRLAAYWTDRGHDELAWNWWQRVVRDKSQRARLVPIHRLQAAACCRRLGRLSLLPTLLVGMSDDESVQVGGRNTTVGVARHDLLRNPVAEAVLTAAAANRDTVGRNASMVGSPPALSHALWRVGLAGDQSRHLESLARAWEGHQLLYGLPIGTSQTPLIVCDRLVYRDFEGIRAVDVNTGRPQWFVPCVSTVGREISARQTIPADGNPDPNNVMRHIVGNAGVHALATDGRLVFAIDRIEKEEATPNGAGAGDSTAATRQQCNTLVAFVVAGSDPSREPLWTIGGRTDGISTSLKGHYFLGAPLAVADRLLVVSECRQQLCLSCLAASSGALIWTQPLCSVSQPISSDYQRTGLACAPSYGDGIVVCPTQAGVLVAVDALTGTLLWAASHDEGESQQRQQMSAWLHHARRPCASAAYVNLPVIHGSRLFYLPAHSEFIYCVDLASGRLLWRSRREDFESATATEFVAAVSDSTVLIVGRRRCRGLDFETGAERWGVRIGSSPAGQGVRLGSQYHLPLDNGGIIGLELDTGRVALHPRGTGSLPLGNLIGARDVIVSMGPAEIVVFPQAELQLERVRSQPQDSANGHDVGLKIAELELILDRLDSAELRLEEILKRSPATAAVDQATGLLREVLRRRLAADDTRSTADLARLARLSQSPEHFGKYLLVRRRARIEGNDLTETLVAVRDASSRADGPPYVVGDDPSRQVTGLVLAAGDAQHLEGVNSQAAQSLETQTSDAVKQAVKKPRFNGAPPLDKAAGRSIAGR